MKSSKSCLTTPKATFFVLGWIAERLPHLVKEIHSRGHEVASHGFQHTLCTDSSPQDLRKDLIESKKRLEDTIGAPVHGYRAPSFSINDDILKIIEECGYLYDSSFNSFGMHGRYGKAHLSQDTKNGIAAKISDSFFELPISNLNLKNPFSNACPVKFFEKDSKADLTGVPSAISSEQNKGSFVLPWGGGGYFRLIPFPIFSKGVKSILNKKNAYLFYFHPWEIDPDQPRVNGAPGFYKIRHYVNLKKTHSKLYKFLESFNQCRFITCNQYLEIHSSPEYPI